MKILVKFPTRGRPDKFAATLHTYQHTRSTDNVDFLITIDRDDVRMNNPRLLANLMQWGNLKIQIIDGCGKIGAINYGLAEVSKDYDIILLASDDMVPVGKGWDRKIIDDMTKYYPDTDGVLWYNDGYSKNKLNTLCILGTKYFRRFGYIYHPSYAAFWCDNEFMDVANHLNKQTYFEEVIIRHEHPIHGYGKNDYLNIRDNQHYYSDERNYQRRKAAGFDLAFHSHTHLTGEGSVIGAVAQSAEKANPKRKRRRKDTDQSVDGQPGADDRSQAEPADAERAG